MKKHYDFSKSVRNPYLSKKQLTARNSQLLIAFPVSVTVSITPELHAQLRELKARNGIPIAVSIRMAIVQYLKRQTRYL